MAEQPVMDSATDNPSPETVVPTPKPYKNEGEAVNDLKNLLNASRTQKFQVKHQKRQKPIQK